MTNSERKELARCRIDKIVVLRLPDAFDLTIHWKSGAKTSHQIYRRSARRKLVLELHGQGLSVHQIRDKLMKGETSTGQVWKLTEDSIYSILKCAGLRPHKYCSTLRDAKRIAYDLYQQKMGPKKIADELNERGFRRPICAKKFSAKTVLTLLKNVPRRSHQIHSLHREVFSELESRGLSNREIARELNRRNIPRVMTSRPWSKWVVMQKRRLFRKGGRQARSNEGSVERDPKPGKGTAYCDRK